MNITNYRHTVFITLILSYFVSLSSHANVNTPNIDNTKPLPVLESMNQLGELKATMPVMERFVSANGVPVLLTRTHELPMVDVSISFVAGSAYDTQIRADGFGIANMVATMLTQGTDTLTEDEFVFASEQLGISLDSNATRDSLSVGLRSLSDKVTLDKAVALMASTLSTPAFDNDVLTRNKNRLALSLQQSEQRPNYLANVAFAKAAFGNHPYAHPITGTKDSVANISQADLQAFKDRFLVARNAIITITGDVDTSTATQIANTLSTALAQGTPAPNLPTPAKPAPTRIHINHPSPQTSIIIGHLSEPRATNQQAMQSATNFMLANDVLAGGEFSARLMNEIRVKQGYTYGIYGSTSRLKNAGLYTISFSANNDVATAAINDSLKVIQDTLDNGISQSELTLAKDNASNSEPMRFASNASIHGVANMMNFFALPDSYLTDSTARIHKTSLDSVNDTLRQSIYPNDFIIITVGGETANKDTGNTADKTASNTTSKDTDKDTGKPTADNP
ncbi:MAG: pitrilysin family protein [Moraxella sp.]|nr:pitrilysin family protein [Moraxella sp.]